MSWPLVFAIFGTAVAVGRLLDGLHRTYSRELRDRLYANAIRYDELSHVQLIHADSQRARFIIDRVLGKEVISSRMLLLSGAGAYCTYCPDFVLFGGSFGGALDFSLGPLLVALIINLVLDQIGVHFTKWSLTRIRPTVGSLFGWIIFDLAIAATFSLLPAFILFGSFFGGLAVLSGFFPTISLRRFIWAAISFVLGTGLILLGGMLPTLIHIGIIARDLTMKAISRPSSASKT
jgi:hypothetical protein